MIQCILFIRNNGIERYFELDYVLDQINEVSKYD